MIILIEILWTYIYLRFFETDHLLNVFYRN